MLVRIVNFDGRHKSGKLESDVYVVKSQVAPDIATYEVVREDGLGRQVFLTELFSFQPVLV